MKEFVRLYLLGLVDLFCSGWMVVLVKISVRVSHDRKSVMSFVSSRCVLNRENENIVHQLSFDSPLTSYGSG